MSSSNRHEFPLASFFDRPRDVVYVCHDKSRSLPSACPRRVRASLILAAKFSIRATIRRCSGPAGRGILRARNFFPSDRFLLRWGATCILNSKPLSHAELRRKILPQIKRICSVSVIQQSREIRFKRSNRRHLLLRLQRNLSRQTDGYRRNHPPRLCGLIGPNFRTR